MADGIVLNAGSGGSTLATHEASAISAAGLQQYELVQLVTGTGLAKTFVNVNNALPVALSLSSTFTTTTASATAIDTIVGAPGASSAIRVLTILATNKSTTLTRVKFAESASNAVRVVGDCALGGGGFFWAPKRSWILPLNTALTGIVSPAASDVAITVEYVIE